MFVAGVLCADVQRLQVLMIIRLAVRRRKVPVCVKVEPFKSTYGEHSELERSSGSNSISGIGLSCHFLALWGTALHIVGK